MNGINVSVESLVCLLEIAKRNGFSKEQLGFRYDPAFKKEIFVNLRNSEDFKVSDNVDWTPISFMGVPFKAKQGFKGVGVYLRRSRNG